MHGGGLERSSQSKRCCVWPTRITDGDVARFIVKNNILLSVQNMKSFTEAEFSDLWNDEY